jgi:hypothetical protein
MSRARVTVDSNLLPSKGMPGGTVGVTLAGKNAATTTLFADQNSKGTLANPYTTANGKVEFWIAGQQDVDITATPAGGSAAVVMNQHATAAVGQHQTLTGPGGKVYGWHQS